MISRTLVPLLLSSSLLALPASSQVPVPVGDEFQVNTYVTGLQSNPNVAATAAGDFVVVWTSLLQDGDSTSVQGQRFDAAGQRLGGEFQVNTLTTFDQFSSAVAVAPSGDFMVVWETFLGGDVQGIRGQRFDAGGLPLGTEFEVNSYTPTRQAAPDVAAMPDGGFVVVWSSYHDGDRKSIHGQRFDSAGNPLAAELQVNTYTTGDQRYPAVATDDAGGFVIVWESTLASGVPTSYFGVQAQRFDSLGKRIGGEFQVNTYTTALTYWPPSPRLAIDVDGRFVVVWNSYQDGFYSSVHGRRFGADGTPAGPEFQVNSYTFSYQFSADVKFDQKGDFTIVWTSYSQDGFDHSVQTRRYASGGAPLGSELQVNIATAGRQSNQALAVAANGDFVVVWNSCHQAICLDPGVGEVGAKASSGDVPPDTFESVQARRFTLDAIFADGFESGDTSAWTSTEPTPMPSSW